MGSYSYAFFKLVMVIHHIHIVTCTFCDASHQQLLHHPQAPDLPQPSDSCGGPFPTLVKIDLGHKFVVLENVVRIQPSAVVLNR